MRYQTLDLRVTRRDDGALVVHAEWAHGRGTDVAELDPLLERDLERLVDDRVDRVFLRDVGGRLFDGLLRSGAGQAGDQLNQCWGAAKREPGQGIRIRLRFEDPEVGRLPWEFLFWPARDSFMATSVQTGLVRFLEVPDTPSDPEVRLPVRVLVVSPEAAGLDSATEVRNLSSVLDELSGVEFRVLDGAVTRERIRDALREDEHHVLHFIGHGGVDEAGPYVVVNGEGGDEALDDAQFAGLLENHPTLELVTLNSCRGAEQSRDGPFVGMAQRLVARGIPAVVAMQYRIYDRVALDFSREFYKSLFTGRSRGDVEVAIARARSSLETDFPDTPALGTPVLFLNRENGVLFDLVEGRLLGDLPTHVDRAHVLKGVEEIRRKRVEHLEREATEADVDGRDELRALQTEREALRRVQRRLRVGAALAVLPTAVAVVVFLASWLYVLDGLSRWARLETLTVRLAELGGPEGVHADVAVVAIDSLDVVEEEPWGTAWRPRVAGLLDRLSEAGASVVALDISFIATTPHDEELAAALRRAEQRGTRVIIGVESLGGDHQPEIAPALRFADWGTLCAATGAQQVVDLVVRKAGDGGPSTELPSLPLRAVAAHLGLEIAALEPARRRVLLLDERNRPTPLGFAAVQRIAHSSPGCPVLARGDSVASLVVDYSRRGALRDTRRRMTYGTVMAAGASLTRLTDKLVVVGVETGDIVVSLYPGMSGERRFGFEIMADAASTLLSGRLIRPVPGWASFALILLLALMGAALALWSRAERRWRTAVALGTVLVLLVAGAVWAYRAAGMMILVAYPATALFLGFWGMVTMRRWRFT